MSILTIYVLPLHTTFLVDLLSLGPMTFSAAIPNGPSLKTVLEHPQIPKVMFDVRQDSFALFKIFGVRLDGVEDIQLMELATRKYNRSFVKGLDKCIEYDAPMSFADRIRWQIEKQNIRTIFEPGNEDVRDVFRRPISLPTQKYCMQQVRYLPRLWDLYSSQLAPDSKSMVQRESMERVLKTHDPAYNPRGDHMAHAPAHWRTSSY
ncbi:hypothetical protein BDV25DRAFT_138621 [Aspergillus avenaceus]|uniref:3'-5' exonuclease domain-containing protein n=1 Tax=Aspergillus avenaceus TaxID=36643 RepID=A0A5N6TZ89_ASPAV|nr:hypothetical protein BDV25DRAFT_138621 [Aspergillus avenaceus]